MHHVISKRCKFVSGSDEKEQNYKYDTISRDTTSSTTYHRLTDVFGLAYKSRVFSFNQLRYSANLQLASRIDDLLLNKYKFWFLFAVNCRNAVDLNLFPDKQDCSVFASLNNWLMTYRFSSDHNFHTILPFHCHSSLFFSSLFLSVGHNFHMFLHLRILFLHSSVLFCHLSSYLFGVPSLPPLPCRLAGFSADIHRMHLSNVSPSPGNLPLSSMIYPRQLSDWFP